jgi:hypothetical protein
MTTQQQHCVAPRSINESPLLLGEKRIGVRKRGSVPKTNFHSISHSISSSEIMFANVMLRYAILCLLGAVPDTNVGLQAPVATLFT